MIAIACYSSANTWLGFYARHSQLYVQPCGTIVCRPLDDIMQTVNNSTVLFATTEEAQAYLNNAPDLIADHEGKAIFKPFDISKVWHQLAVIAAIKHPGNNLLLTNHKGKYLHYDALRGVYAMRPGITGAFICDGLTLEYFKSFQPHFTFGPVLLEDVLNIVA